jgi:secondary thiamine-phosphate synthase enzyme
MVYQREILVQTSGHKEMHNLTDEVVRIVNESKVRHGIVHIFSIGSTAAIGTIEFEPGLEEDLPEMLDKLMPPSRDYGHERAWHDGNGHSHLQATLLGPSLTVPVKEGKLVLGTWQQVFHLECDIKPRRRAIAITVMGDA